ncbi:MAG: Gfo/Idh/MocA family protein, partial [bacterium]
MKFLVVGLGSMGKRRIRCLKRLNFNNIIGYDINKERANEVKNLYNIEIVNDLENIKVDAIFISTPPDKHKDYALWTIDNNIHAFIEASVLLKDSIDIKNYLINKKTDIIIAPSSTLVFHPVIKDIKNIILSKTYGKICNFSYHSGQYLPDWHPWEDIKDFYVGKKETGGAREIVAFELTWITHILGFPSEIKGFFGKTINLGVDIDDTYVFNLKFDNEKIFGSIIVDVTSRYPTRSLIMNLENAQIRWDWNNKYFEVFDAIKKRFILYYQPEGEVALGYNKNIIEDMYIEETKAFIDSILYKKPFLNDLDRNIKVLELL